MYCKESQYLLFYSHIINVWLTLHLQTKKKFLGTGEETEEYFAGSKAIVCQAVTTLCLYVLLLHQSFYIIFGVKITQKHKSSTVLPNENSHDLTQTLRINDISDLLSVLKENK